MPATITGILETALYVSDIEQSAAFYEKLMGFRRLLAEDRNPEASSDGLHPAHALAVNVADEHDIVLGLAHIRRWRM